MKKVKKILFGFITGFIVLIFLINIYSVINIKILKKDYASFFGYTLLEVVSGSMEPTIYKGDMIIINTKDKDLNINDIITFKDAEGSFVTHKIISIENDKIITKGDNNNTIDDAINKNSVIGKYAFKIKGAGNILNSFKNPLTLIMILIIGILVCAFLSVDKDGNLVLTEEEKEYLEYKKDQNKKPKNNKKVAATKKVETTKKATSKKDSVKKTNARIKKQ